MSECKSVISEAQCKINRQEGIRTTLEQIEQCVSGVSTVCDRLHVIVDGSRGYLTIAILTDQCCRADWGVEASQAVLYCLLNYDWVSLATVVEAESELKSGLSRILGITDEEWDYLRDGEPGTNDLYRAVDDFVDRLLKM
ncbi:MAG: hypothetical protein CVT67_02860 [Actinobacteria bacterium HGW-Actinobacteria-7]|nr:MAG: hypothetical protein CVT67_02860 [Actinobacteria bacterium HGW-Actinobacteria-7]